MTNTDVRPPGPDRVTAPAPPEGGYPDDGGTDSSAPWQPVRLPGLRLAAVLAVLAVVGFLFPWVLVVILALLVMIFLHELGHFVMARRADMKVTEFFLGFGPRIWSFKRGEVEYGLKCIPAGAYVKIIGMTNLEEVPPEDEARTYRQKSFGQRVGVAVAGSTMHFLIALVLIFVLLTTIGVPGGRISAGAPSNWRVGDVSKGSAAQEAGLAKGDKVLSIDGEKVGTFEDMKGIVTPLRNKTVVVRYLHGTQVRQAKVKLHDFTSTVAGTKEKACCLGIGMLAPKSETVGAVAAVPRTFDGFGAIAKASVLGFGKIFSPSGISGFADQVARAGDKPAATSSGSGAKAGSGGSSGTTSAKDLETRPVSIVGIVNLGSQFGDDGGTGLIAFFALINIFIGLFNLVPLLPFDGGHVAVACFEKVQEIRLRRRGRYFVDAARLLPLTYVVVGLLGLLFVSTLYLDILNPIKT